MRFVGVIIMFLSGLAITVHGSVAMARDLGWRSFEEWVLGGVAIVVATQVLTEEPERHK